MSSWIRGHTVVLRLEEDLLPGAWRVASHFGVAAVAVIVTDRDRLPNPLAMKAPSVKRPIGAPLHKSAVA